ncbi:hypothetical protein [Williamsia sterculiae]|uniref:Phospho-glucose isomerase C-terminal SIS domain-containing protein n=1 Tax=Williamsia sterculiae TaxID=1344003 RepID=A0A1N7FQS6_9NOCA|nr:hypothetical protein [Williamsia sterculiae]SIS02671.1 hypothetical protein SAMN05445060_2202 [Williamsia sterculiae]
MLTGTSDLDDVEALQAADADGLLHGVAMAGAQARAVHSTVAEGVLSALEGLRPRSVVVVAAAGTAERAMEFAIAVAGPRLDVPVVGVTALPGWVGPLDVVVLCGDDAGDPILIDAGDRASRRGAEVVLLAPDEGPLAEALGGRALDLSPRMRVLPHFRFTGYVAGVLAVFGALSSVRFTGTRVDVARLADALDEEAAADGPGAEIFHNAAKLLAARLGEQPVIWVGDTPAARAVAAHAATTVLTVAGTLGAVASVSEALSASVETTRRTGVSADDIFHDPQIDGPRVSPPRLQVITVPGREWFVRHGLGPAVEMDVLTAGDETPPPTQPTQAFTDDPGDVIALLTVALRIEMASVYLRLSAAA